MEHAAEEQSVVSTESAESPTMFIIDGATLLTMFEGGAGWLERHVPHINALNVFPVPDGDTGTNMMLTIQSAVKELRSQTGEHSVREVAQRMARGALMGARGNSGVILSQILRGIADGLADKERATVSDFAAALGHARERAYKAVHKSVEGTILTVMREAADAPKARADAAGESLSILDLLREVVSAAKRAELETPELLPVLKEAGVTDSGGHGLWVFFDGALRRLSGEEIHYGQGPSAEEFADFATSVGHPGGGSAPEGEWGYDIQYLIKGRAEKPLDVEEIRRYISSIGDCALVVGDETLVKVHVHCPNPGPAITYGAEQGIIGDVVVENMDEQAAEFRTEEPAPTPSAGGTGVAARSTDEVTGIGIVAVAPGEGLSELFRSLGVSQMVAGGQTMNPSTKDILDAVEAIAADTVIILPNNKNIILSAQQVPPLTEKTIHVLPTRTVPQGIAAVMAFNYAGGIDENVAAMQRAIDHVQTGEVTTGIRTTVVNGVSVNEGDIISIHNGKLVVAAPEPESAIRGILDQIELDDYEFASFFHGENISPEEAERIIEAIGEAYPSLEIELMAGGQPHYHFIFSVE